MFLTQLKMSGTVLLLACLAIAGIITLALHTVPQTAEAAPQALPSSAVTMARAVPLAAGQSDEEPAIHYVELQPHANQKLTETFVPANFADNHLSELKQGKVTLEGFKFNVGAGLIRLANG